MTKINYKHTHFFTSAYDIINLPADTGIEIAITGSSNSGKSSIINTLTNNKKLARTSKKPGSTMSINIFEVAKGKKIVDLPGYGYKKISKKIGVKLQNMLDEYLKNRLCLSGLIIIMDIRNPLKPLDIKMIHFGVSSNMKILILLSKSDKLSSKLRNLQVSIVRKKLISLNLNVQVEAFSSHKNYGIDNLYYYINNRFRLAL